MNPKSQRQNLTIGGSQAAIFLSYSPLKAEWKDPQIQYYIICLECV